MMYILVIIVLVCCCALPATQDKHPEFLGGSLSYELVKVGTNTQRVDVTVISGWVLGTGPCGPNCTRTDVGTSTISTRNQIQQRMSNAAYFGKFYIDYMNSTTTEHQELILHEGNMNSMAESVLAVNEHAKWEQEITQFSFDLAPDLTAGEINFDGSFWRHLTLQGSSIKWHLQSGFDSDIRNDTGKPNACPEVSFRPYYRVKLGTSSSIRMATLDRDDDIVKCFPPQFVESGAGNGLKGVVVNEDCSVTINTDTSFGYTDDTWLAVKVKVNDFNTRLITYGTKLYPPYPTFSLSSTVLQFAVNVLSQVETLSFVSPTPEVGHTFIIYAGAKWSLQIFAQASENTTVHKVTTMSKVSIEVSSVKYSLSDNRIANAMISWSPTVADIGSYSVCVSAEDNTGVQSDEMRCYKLTVKENTYSHSTASTSTSKPYFIDIPSPQQNIDCPKHSTCHVPLYIHSSSTIGGVRIVVDFTDDARVDKVVHTTHNNQAVYKADLSFIDNSKGQKQICVVATDINNVESDQACVMVYIEPRDPCISSPCQNSGICKANGDTGTFTCLCTDTSILKISGELCESAVTVCATIDCGNGQCTSKLYERTDGSGIKSHCVSCAHGYGGPYCDEVINTCPINACSNQGVCVNTVGNSSCTCNKRYTGANCDVDQCPNSVKALECVSDVCKSDPCNGNGVCMSGPSGAICTCTSGFTGTYCLTAKTDIHPSVTDIDFVQPTPKNGATLTCYKKNNQLTSCSIAIFFVSSGTPTLQLEASESLTTTQNGLTKNTHDPKLYHTEIQIQGDAVKDAGICVKLLLSTVTKNRCFDILIKTDPVEDVLSQRYSQRNAEVKFVEPTLNDGSKLICDVGETCMMMIHTTKPSSGCEDVASPSDGVTVFPTKLNTDTNLCDTEVSVTFAAANKETICLQSAMVNFQQICYDFDSYDVGTDPCLTSPCQNGGLCVRSDLTNYKCKCSVEYTGDKCEKGPCAAVDNNCRSDSYCSIDDGTKTCHCKTGFFGPLCGNASISRAASMTVLFTDVVTPSVLQCVLDQPCSTSFVLSGGHVAPPLFKSNLPAIQPGYIDAEIEVNKIDIKSLSQLNMFQSDITLTGNAVGKFDMCIQAQYLLIIRSSIDEICFKVDVTPDVSSLYGYKDRPHFVAPSLPSQSKVICTEGSTCHVLYSVTSGDGNSGKCLSVYRTSHSDSLKFHIFSTCEPCTTGAATNSDCEVDVSIEPPPAGNDDTLCIGLRLDSGLKGEERCFKIHVQSTQERDDIRDHNCVNLHCQWGGFCDGHTHTCYCKNGKKMNNCFQAIEAGPQDKTFVAETMSIPETISCEIDTICTVPFAIITHVSTNTSCSVGYSAPQLRALIQDGSPKMGSFTRTLQIHPSSIGTFKTCVQLNDAETATDEICLTVHVIESPTDVLDKTKPYFNAPTLPDHTTVLCKSMNKCHLSLYFANGGTFGHNNECPTVRQVSPTTVRTLHIFEPEKQTTANHDCFSDVEYKTNSEGTVEFCVQLAFPGMKGEKRCFFLQSVDDIESNLVSPCKGVKCYNEGKCIADVDSSTSRCICKAGYTGSDCNTALDKTPFLPGVDNIPTTASTSTQRFGIDSALPKTIQCYGFGEGCYFTIPYYGSKAPFFRFYDPLLQLYPQTSMTYGNEHVTKLYITTNGGSHHRMCVQTTDDGQDSGLNIDELCFEIEAHPAGPAVEQTLPHFKASMQNGSVVVCQPSQTCHVYVTTSMMSPNHHCPQVSQCGEEIPGTYVFNTIRTLGKCLTEVAVTSGTDDSMHDLCLSAGTDGEERHIIIETSNNANGYGPCQKLHCLNGGTCLSKSATRAECSCTDDYAGTKCHIHNPCKGFTCLNNGICKPDLTIPTIPRTLCFCPAGYDGPTCSTAVDPTSDLKGIENFNSAANPSHQHFMPNGAVPNVVSCEENVPCCITVPYYGNVNKPPLLGYHDTSLSITTREVLATTDTNLHNLVTCVNGSLGQSHRMCLQTTTDETKQGINVDEMCFEVEKKQGEETRSVDEPQFINTLPNMTRVVCTINKLCHIQMRTTSIAGICQQIEECGEKTTGLFAQPPKPDGDKCLTDIVYKTGGAGESTDLCLSAGYEGEERHLVVETKNTPEEYGQCQKLHCLNSGRCMSRDITGPAQCDCHPEHSGEKCELSPCVGITCQNHGKCVADLKSITPKGMCACSSEYTGDHCQTAMDHSQNLPGVDNITPDVPSSNQHFDTNIAVPKNIQCFENMTCSVPISYNGANSFPYVNDLHPWYVRNVCSAHCAGCSTPNNLRTKQNCPGQCAESSTPNTLRTKRNRKPILGYHDPSLNIEPVTSMSKDSNPGSHSNIALVHFTGDPGTHKMCLQTTTNGTEAGVNVDEICFGVTIQPGDKPDAKGGAQFTEGLPDGSTVTCQPNSVCHIPVVTEKHGASCEQLARCGHYTIGVQIHNAREVGGKCLSDVAIVTGADDETDEVCISAGPNGEAKHIIVETKDQTNKEFGPCQKLHCLNGGKCISETSTSVCTCPAQYTGTTCEMQICVQTTCQHGQCVLDPHSQTGGEICLCDNGYMDDHCTTAVPSNTDLPGVDNVPSNTGGTAGSTSGGTSSGTNGGTSGNTLTPNHHFDSNSAIPTELKCDDVNSCCISVPYHGDVTKPPYVGYHSPGLAVDTTTVIPDATNPGLNTLVICVKGIPGNHKICLQTSNDGTRQGVNIDELCTDITITKEGTITTPIEPHFASTVPDRTKVVCNHDTTCPVPIVTDKHNGVCDPVTTCAGTTIGSRIYYTTDTGSQCLTYIGLKTDAVDRTDTLCVSAGTGGEERTLIIESKNTNTNGFGPCQKLHCLNGGSCVSRTSTPVCECLSEYAGQHCELTPCASITCQHGGHCVTDLTTSAPVGICVCTSGFSGPLCASPLSKNTDLPGVDNIPSLVTPATQHFGRDIAIPKDIFCDGVQPCCITIPYQGDGSKPPVVGYMDPALTVVPGSTSTITDALGSGSHTSSTCVTGVTGKHRLCLQTTSDGTDIGVNLDEFCVNIQKDNTSLSSPTSKPHFTNTLPNGTTVECRPNFVCHVSVVTDPHNNNCENVEKCIGTTLGTTSLTTNSVSGKCITDIGIKTGDSGSIDNICLSAGPNGEERHFKIESTDPPNEGYGPCQKLHCLNGGKCKAETEEAKCECPQNFVGETCAVDKDTFLPGIDSIPSIPLGNQRFIKNGAIPTTVTCDILNPCCISIPYHGDKDLPPILGYHDHDLKVLPILSAITPDQIQHPENHVAEVCVKGKPGKNSKLCLQTTSNGTEEGVNIDEFCIQVQINPEANVTPMPSTSFNPRIPDGTTLVCKPSSTCHISVVADKHGTCDQVRQCGQTLSNVNVVATTAVGDKCVTDVKIGTGATEKIDQLCITTGTGTQGSRHFQVETKSQQEFGPCQKLHCFNGGNCLSATNSARCECFNGFGGNTCESNETDSCETTEERDFARKMVVTGYASCSCIVDGKIVDIIKKKPVPNSESIVKAAGFGAGGMVGTVVIGIFIYAIVSKLRTPKPQMRTPTPGSRRQSMSPKPKKVHPQTQERLRNIDAF